MTAAILVTGAREWTDEKLVYDTLLPYKNTKYILIHGDCVGLDKIAGKIANEIGLIVQTYPADWKKFGKSAGPKRNKQMIDELLKYNTKIMFAFHDAIDKSKGTLNCINQAKKVNITCTIISHR